MHDKDTRVAIPWIVTAFALVTISGGARRGSIGPASPCGARDRLSEEADVGGTQAPARTPMIEIRRRPALQQREETAMANRSMEPVPSAAAIKGHPLHPMLVPFPIAFLVGTLVTDLANRFTSDAFWAQASYWLAVAGLATGVLAALMGLIDFLRRRKIRALSIAWFHFLGNGVALVLTFVNISIRIPDPSAPVSAAALALSVIVTGVLLVTGWLGGEMVFRHRIGEIEEPQSPAGAHDVGESVARIRR